MTTKDIQSLEEQYRKVPLNEWVEDEALRRNDPEYNRLYSRIIHIPITIVNVAANIVFAFNEDLLKRYQVGAGEGASQEEAIRKYLERLRKLNPNDKITMGEITVKTGDEI